MRLLAEGCGFSAVAGLDSGSIVVREEVRAACAANKCGAYGLNWACPPACGSLEDCAAKMRAFSSGVLVQSSSALRDSFDYPAMEEAGRRHNRRLRRFAEKLKALHPRALVLGAGPCTVCRPCTYPSLPCRFPDKMASSLEAQGIVVSELCLANNLPYYYGPGILTYTGCALFSANIFRMVKPSVA